MPNATGSPAAGTPDREVHRAGRAGTPTTSGHNVPTRPSVDFLRECFRHDEETGDLFWRTRPPAHFVSARNMKAFNAEFAGARADLSTYPTKGYRRVRLSIGGKKLAISAHLVVFALVHGKWPTHEIDHIDRCKTNNSPSNLRDVPHSENMRNLPVRKPRLPRRGHRP